MRVMKALIRSSYWLVASMHRTKHQSPIACRGGICTEVAAAVFHNIEGHLLSDDDVIYPKFLTSFLPLIVFQSYIILYFGA